MSLVAMAPYNSLQVSLPAGGQSAHVRSLLPARIKGTWRAPGTQSCTSAGPLPSGAQRRALPEALPVRPRLRRVATGWGAGRQGVGRQKSSTSEASLAIRNGMAEPHTLCTSSQARHCAIRCHTPCPPRPPVNMAMKSPSAFANNSSATSVGSSLHMGSKNAALRVVGAAFGMWQGRAGKSMQFRCAKQSPHRTPIQEVYTNSKNQSPMTKKRLPLKLEIAWLMRGPIMSATDAKTPSCTGKRPSSPGQRHCCECDQTAAQRMTPPRCMC